MNKDFQVIEEALQGKRFTQLQCKRYDVDTAKKELNEDVCVEHKRLNHYIHQKVSGIIMIWSYEMLRNAACEDLKISDFDWETSTCSKRQTSKKKTINVFDF